MKKSKVVGEVNARAGAADGSAALPTAEVCKNARLSRDPRFDGRFVVAVLSTGIFCRPTCPARRPAEHNVRYFVTAAAAAEAGYRPCKRCQPEMALVTPEWVLRNPHLGRALRFIDEGFLNDRSVAALASRLGISERHLERIFVQLLGVTPSVIARFKRVQLARQLLATDLSLVQVANHAGYGSVSQFNREIRKIFHSTPSALRKARGSSQGTQTLSLTLPVHQPYNFDWMFDYLRIRAMEGLEEVVGHRYVRHLPHQQGSVVVAREGQNLRVHLPLNAGSIHTLLRRIVRIFDLEADSSAIHAHLVQHDLLAPWVKQAPGLRVPGAWDGSETAIRAILGQQVSVARGTELANALIRRYGQGEFPTAKQLCGSEIAEIGMPGRRGRAISMLAQAVLNAEIDLSSTCDQDLLVSALTAIPGIGPWTTSYIKMRVCKDPNAFLHNDWVVLKQLAATPAKAAAQASAWQPWRAYALMYLWFAAGQRRARLENT